MKIRPDQSAIQSTQSTDSTEIKSNSSQTIKETKTGPSLESRWENFVSNTATSGGAVDPNALVQHVLRESYLQTTEDLRFYAEKVKYFNEQKKLVRDYLQDLRDYDSSEKKDQAIKLVDQLKPGAQNGNVMESLLLVMKESIKDTNEDKKYYLDKLASMNKTSTSLSAQNEIIAEASRRLATTEKKDDDDD
jgi:hypothetical protein